jgi:acyl-CoA thioester hydrolase
MNHHAPEWHRAAVGLDLAVRFAETDLMGVVHHGAYIVWFEAGRVAWMQAARMPYTEVADGGNHLAVTGISAEYRTGARFGDTVRVVTRLERLRSRQVTFTYEVRLAADPNILFATGSSDHICVDLEGRMAKIPASVVSKLMDGAKFLAASGGTVLGETSGKSARSAPDGR